ncbi:MAG: DJ-1/PfpI family protein [Xanthomonadales bacterium]|nr:DJ-1/PfpI family protein [Xanthomonadales bacterium]
MTRRVLIPVADGTEELEAVTMIDLLRRAGIEVVVASLDGEPVVCSRGVKLQPDQSLNEALASEYDMIALPGGLPGADHLAEDPRIRDRVQNMHAQGRFVAAICAAPKVLARAGVLDGRRATSFPGVLESEGHALVTGDAWTRDGTVLTSRGPGTAMDFALLLIETLVGPDQRQEVEAALQRP